MVKIKSGWLAVLLVGGLGLISQADDAPKPAETGTLVVIDAAGKEQKLKSWKFVAGVQRMSWLAPEKAEEKPDKDPTPAKGAPGKKGKAASSRWKLTVSPVDFRSETLQLTVLGADFAARSISTDETSVGKLRPLRIAVAMSAWPGPPSPRARTCCFAPRPATARPSPRSCPSSANSRRGRAAFAACTWRR